METEDVPDAMTHAARGGTNKAMDGLQNQVHWSIAGKKDSGVFAFTQRLGGIEHG